MNGAKYQEDFLNLIKDIMSENQEISSIDIIKQKTKNILEKYKNCSEEQTNDIGNYLMRQLRLKYQKEILNSIDKESKIISLAKLIIEYIFWFVHEIKYGLFNNSLKILQDIVETIPSTGLEQIFDSIKLFLTKIEIELFELGQFDILFIINSLMKRTEINLDKNLRGKIQLLYCELFSLTDKSGVNKLGKYSLNQINEENSDNIKEDKMEIEDEKKEEVAKDEVKKVTKEENKEDLLIQFYTQFWIIEKILLNPFTVCSLIIINYIIIILKIIVI